MRKEDFVRTQLSKLPEVTFTDDEATILCPFHDDHNPSLRVTLNRQTTRKGKTLSPGAFYCFSCSSGGGWNALAEKANEKFGSKLLLWDAKEADKTADNVFVGLKHDLIQIAKHQSFVYKPPALDGEWEGPWRELSGQFLRDHGAQTLWDHIDEDYRIYLPVRDVSGNLVGHVGARPDGSTIPNKRKYVNSYGFPSDQVWYCLDKEVMKPSVIVVEGPYDTLRFRNRGLPAIGCFGVSTLSQSKIYQLLSAGIQKVILCLDGDDAGRAAVPYFTLEMKRQGITVADMDLTRYGQDKVDPGNCCDQAIEDLRNFITVF